MAIFMELTQAIRLDITSVIFLLGGLSKTNGYRSPGLFFKSSQFWICRLLMNLSVVSNNFNWKKLTGVYLRSQFGDKTYYNPSLFWISFLWDLGLSCSF